MIHQFTVVASLNIGNPQASYFATLRRDAQVALTGPVAYAEAWSLCEYLDCVDSQDLPYEKALYSACVDALGGFLQKNLKHKVVRDLANCSWAANTLVGLLDSQANTPANTPTNTPTARLQAA